MTALFSQLFLSLQEQIRTYCPAIAWIDQDLGQLEYYDTRPAVAFPCVLIDFQQSQYERLGNGHQWWMGGISFRIGFSPFASANSEAPDISKEHALQFYEIENQLYEALEGFTANDAVQPLTRISANTERREDPFRVRELVFATATEDDTARPITIKQSVTPEFPH